MRTEFITDMSRAFRKRMEAYGANEAELIHIDSVIKASFHTAIYMSGEKKPSSCDELSMILRVSFIPISSAWSMFLACKTGKVEKEESAWAYDLLGELSNNIVQSFIDHQEKLMSN